MASAVEAYPRIGQFMGVSKDETVGRYRIMIYAALNCRGLIGSECNGIAVVDDVENRVVCDEIAIQDSGYFGPGPQQVTMWETLVKMAKDKPEAFCAFINDQPRCRAPIEVG